MPNDTIDPLPLEPEEENEEVNPEEAPLAEDAYASSIRQNLLDQSPETKSPKGFARLFSGISSIFGRKSQADEQEQEPQVEQSYRPEISSTPMLDMDELVVPKGYSLDEDEAEVDPEPGAFTEEFDPSVPAESAFDLYTEEDQPVPNSPSNPFFEIEEEEQQPEQADSIFPFLDLESDEVGEKQEEPGGSQVTPFWEMYRTGGIDQEQEPGPMEVPQLPESEPPQPAPVTSEDEKEWKAFLSNLLKRQDDKPSSLEMDDHQLTDRLQSAGLVNSAEDGMPKPKTGKLKEPTANEKTAPFVWEKEIPSGESEKDPDREEQPNPPGFDEVVDDWFAQDEETASAEEPDEAESSLDPLNDPSAARSAINGSEYYWSDETGKSQKAEESEEAPGAWFSELESPAAGVAPAPFEIGAEPSEEAPFEPSSETPASPLSDESEASPQRLRPIVLEDYEPPPAPEPEEPSALDEVGTKVGGFWRTQSLLTKVTIILLAVFMFGLAVSIPLFNYLLNRPQPVTPAAVAVVVDPNGQPIPIGLKLTGGWFFNLQQSNIEEGVWVPEGAEWLEGTEVRKVVAIPWSRQSEAVVSSLIAGDMLQLHLSDNKIQEYQVDSVEQVDRTDVYMYADNEASLVVILYQANSNKRWVIVSHLVEPER